MTKDYNEIFSKSKEICNNIFYLRTRCILLTFNYIKDGIWDYWDKIQNQFTLELKIIFIKI
jgi:hypothetical protein